jgi:hypothetical protein
MPSRLSVVGSVEYEPTSQTETLDGSVSGVNPTTTRPLSETRCNQQGARPQYHRRRDF